MGELIDRITILEIKAERLAQGLREPASRELASALSLRDRSVPGSSRLHALTESLRRANRELVPINLTLGLLAAFIALGRYA